MFTESRPYGGAYVLDQLWHRLGIAKILARLASPGRGRLRDAAAAEQVLFALVASRALAPSSKLAAAEWMSQDVHIDGLGAVTDDACYRAMDWLHAVRGDLEKQVFDQPATARETTAPSSPSADPARITRPATPWQMPRVRRASSLAIRSR